MRFFAFVIFLMLQLIGFSQIDPSNFERDENTLRVVFYNVENIFDPVDEPNKRDEEFTPDGDRHWDNYKFYDKLKAKNWKYSEDKTGRMMQVTYQDCEIEFLEQKRYPSKKVGEYNSSTKNIIQINRKTFEEVPIHHTKTKHKTDIL